MQPRFVKTGAPPWIVQNAGSFEDSSPLLAFRLQADHGVLDSDG